MTSILLFALGAVLLIYSAEKLIGYLVGIARGLKVSVFLLAIVFTGIEFDDIFLGAVLNLEDMDGVAVGIVFGTGLSMIGIVLALMAIITPSKVNIPRDYLLIFALSPLIMIPFILTPPMTIVDGIILIGLFVAFITYVAVRESRADRPVFRDAEMYEAYAQAREVRGGTAVLERPTTRSGAGGGSSGASERREFSENIPFANLQERSGWKWILLAVIALAGVIAGASLTGMGTEGILEQFGLEETVFGATIATAVLTIEDIFLSVAPARKGAPEIGVANVIGSAVFSVTGKLGIILLLGSLVLDAYVLTWHLPALIVLTGLGAYFLSTGQLRRWHGFVLLGLYVCYWALTFFGLGVVPIEMD